MWLQFSNFGKSCIILVLFHAAQMNVIENFRFVVACFHRISHKFWASDSMFTLWSLLTFDTHFPQKLWTITQNINYDYNYTFFLSRNSFIKIMLFIETLGSLQFAAVQTKCLSIFIISHLLELSYLFHFSRNQTSNSQL